MDIKPTANGINYLDGAIGAVQTNTATDKVKTLSKQEVKDQKDLDKAAKGFEALLLHEMLKSLWETVEVKGWLGHDSNEAQIYRGMLNQAIADSVSEGKGIGIKDVVKKELSKQIGSSKIEEPKDIIGLKMINQGLIDQTTGDEGNENK